MAELPKTSTGKVLKIQLRALAQNFVVNAWDIAKQENYWTQPTFSFRSSQYSSNRICSGPWTSSCSISSLNFEFHI
jgi:hypothetical protein